jgi:TonB family protein
LLTSAGLSAATVSGYIHDANGAAIADAKVSLYNADNSTRQEAMTGPDGQFTLQNSAGGQFFLRIEKSGFTSIFRVVDLKTDTKLDRDLTITNEGTPAIRDSSLATSAAWPSLVRVGGRVAESNIIAKVAPIYPVAAKQAGVQGTVELDVVVSKEGVPEALQVITSPSDDLSQSALEAVRLWRYRPTLLNGNPVPIETSVIVNYTLTK